MSTWLLRLDVPDGPGPRVAVKDLIDVEGTPTTAASRPVAEAAVPAWEDAACVAGIRARGGRIVGKTNLHELAFGGTGINPYTGTPVNPLDAGRIPGGSSSGSAVAVALGEADVALGTDTGGSVRTPSACCGTVGLKTTFGRISTVGVQPLAPSLDVVGPMASTVAGVVVGMELLEPAFEPAPTPAAVLGRLFVHGTHPAIDEAIDLVLRVAEIPVEQTDVSGWDIATRAGATVAFVEAARVHAQLVRDHLDELCPEVQDRFRAAVRIGDDEYRAALAIREPWRHELDMALARTPVVAMAAITDEPPTLDDPLRIDTRRLNVALNLSGHPAIVLPVPRFDGGTRTSIQLFAALGAEELLVTTAAVIEAAVASIV